MKDRTQLAVSSPGESNSFRLDEKFRPLPFSSNGEFEGSVVFAGYGLSVSAIVPLVAGVNDQNITYLETKRDKMGHLLPLDMRGRD